MKPTFIIGNWKSNKNLDETRAWFEETLSHKSEILNLGEKIIILCPPFTLLQECSFLIRKYNLPFKLGAQDISPFPEGRYTGAINGKQIKEFADYVLIGHSERRINFNERDEILAQKLQMAKESGLIPFYFVQNTQTHIPNEADLIIYEPPASISPAPADSPQDVAKAAKFLNEERKVKTILYGGNVTEENVKSFTSINLISGIIPGQASLDAKKFILLIQNA